jgi:hypothetical protein
MRGAHSCATMHSPYDTRLSTPFSLLCFQSSLCPNRFSLLDEMDVLKAVGPRHVLLTANMHSIICRGRCEVD